VVEKKKAGDASPTTDSQGSSSESAGIEPHTIQVEEYDQALSQHANDKEPEDSSAEKSAADAANALISPDLKPNLGDTEPQVAPA
jgi:hypothetical protein